MSEPGDELSELRRKLAEAERRAELLEQLRTAEQLSTVARLASTIAHELGTPLNVISGRAMMIASGEIDGEERLASSRIIVEQANRMAAIIRQILGYLRKHTSVSSPLELNTVLDQALAIVGPRAAERSIKIRIDPESEPLVLQVDPSKLLQLLSFLIARGIRVSAPDGVVVISARKETVAPDSVSNEARRAKDYFAISFVDQGPEISKEALASLFKPFFQADRDPDASALGMSIAHGIVRELGGWMMVESQSGAGTTFKVCLPESVAKPAPRGPIHSDLV